MSIRFSNPWWVVAGAVVLVYRLGSYVYPAQSHREPELAVQPAVS